MLSGSPWDETDVFIHPAGWTLLVDVGVICHTLGLQAFAKVSVL